MMHRAFIAILVGLLVLLAPQPAEAYVGPGAGFALAGSFFAVFMAALSAVVMLFTWPIRFLLRLLLRKRPPGKIRFRRVVVLGLDGLDHGLTSKLLAEHRLPNLARLRDQGTFHSLGSTLPPISPVAWSTFQTGVNPGKHNIFDFLVPDGQTYLPKISSVAIHPPRRRFRWGRWSLPFTQPDVRLLRKSRPFWSILSDYGIFNCIIRVPITFPPEKLHGVQLSAMCVPDLRGTQGEFSHYTTSSVKAGRAEGREVIHVTLQDRKIVSTLSGPPHPHRPDQGPLQIPFQLELIDQEHAILTIGGEQHRLKAGEYTDWISVQFHGGLWAKISGVCKFLLVSTEPELDLYVTPINIDPGRPAMAIGYPQVYPVYLARRQGPFATLGLAEDTWGLNEQVLNDDQFRQQCMDTDRERESMFFDALDKVPQGLCVCVFDGTDRMQHMFWRYHDHQHPACPSEIPASHQHPIEALYERMDGLVGRTMAKCDRPDTLLMVLSDHGFNSFRRGIDLNRWLELHGYLKVDDRRRDEEYLAGIDWSETRAFAIGLTGIFLNLQDRFAQGIVAAGAQAEQLRAEIAAGLSELVDPVDGVKAIRHVYQADKAYHGPYKSQAPDLILGYESGYRVAWEAANGQTSLDVFHTNTRAWSGDHCVDPSVVPGVLFCNRPVQSEAPRLLDIGPTILNLFGIAVPAHMDGRPMSIDETPRNASTRVNSTAAKVT